MEYIEQNIASNITKLRKANKLTQIEFAKKLNYSDKAVSKWERGDSIPDINMLNEIARLFNVDIDFLIKPHTDIDIQNLNKKNRYIFRNLLVAILFCVTVILISTLIFSYGFMKDHMNANTYWVAFVVAAPVCSAIMFLFFLNQKILHGQLVCISAFVWTLIASIFCVTIVVGLPRFWFLFIVGVPVQIALFIVYFWKKTL